MPIPVDMLAQAADDLFSEMVSHARNECCLKPCVACEGTGKSSRNRVCEPCNGTGIQPTTSKARERGFSEQPPAVNGASLPADHHPQDPKRPGAEAEVDHVHV